MRFFHFGNVAVTPVGWWPRSGPGYPLPLPKCLVCYRPLGDTLDTGWRNESHSLCTGGAGNGLSRLVVSSPPERSPPVSTMHLDTSVTKCINILVRQGSCDISAVASTFGDRSLLLKIPKTQAGNYCEVLVAIMKSPQTFLRERVIKHWTHLLSG